MLSGHIFISYARSDGQNYAERLDRELQESGYSVWRDTRNIDPSQDFTAELENAIEDAGCVVTCITPDTRRSDSFVRREIQYALLSDKPVLVARCADVTPPIAVVNHSWIDFHVSWDSAFETLCNQIHHPPEQTQVATLPAGVTPEPDPFHEYLQQLYKQIVRYLNKTVFSVFSNQQSDIIQLGVKVAKDAVDSPTTHAMPRAFFDLAGVTESEDAKEYANLAAAFEYYDGRILLLGKPGSGKTTTLMAFARDAVVRRLEDQKQPLPVLIPIALWDPEKRLPIGQWIEQEISRVAGQIQPLIDTGELLLMLDGLDELGGEREGHSDDGSMAKYDPRALFMRLIPTNNQILVSCRETDYESIGKKLWLNGAVTLQELRDEQIKSYLYHQPRLLNAIENDPALAALTRIPLLLSLCMYAFADENSAPEQLIGLDQDALTERIFRTYLAKRFDHEQRKPHINLPFSLDRFYELMSQVILNEERFKLENVYSLDDFIATHKDETVAQQCVSVAQALNAMVMTGGGSILRFVHQQMRDHIALKPILDRVEQQPGQDTHWARLGHTYHLLRRLEDSAAAYARAIKLNPDSHDNWHQHALVLSELAHSTEAIDCYKKAIDLAPQNIWYKYNYAEELIVLERHDAALEQLDKVLEIQPNHVESWAKRGQVHRKNGRNGEAIHCFERAVELSPEFAWAWNGLGVTYRRVNRLEDASRAYKRAMDIDPAHGWYAINYTHTLLARDDNKTALEVMIEAAKTAHNNPAVLAQYGWLLRLHRRYDEALDNYERALTLAPDYAWVWNGKAMCLWQLGRHDEALVALQEATFHEPGEVMFWYNYAGILYEMGQLIKARAAFSRVLKLGSEHPRVAMRHDKLQRLVNDETHTWSVNLSTGQDTYMVGKAQNIGATYASLLGIHSMSFNPELDLDAQLRLWHSPQPTQLSSASDGGDAQTVRQAGTSPRGDSKEFKIGDRIEDRYEVADVRLGGMGIVYLCYDHERREPVVIKSFQGRFLENERAVARFTQEAFTWIRLEKHPNIVQARLIQNIRGRPHIIMEYITGLEGMGSDLRNWIDTNRLDVAKSIELSLQVALGMRHATQKIPGLVHRDLKPSNILVTHEGVAKVTDFGLVRSIDLQDIRSDDDELTDEMLGASNRLTRVGAIVGTAPYMSPEQVRALDVSMQSDIYAFGCIMFEMVTSHPVFQARRFSEWANSHLHIQPTFDSTEQSKIPAELRQFILKCLHKNPRKRPESWNVVVDELTTIYTTIVGKQLQLEVTGPQLELRDLLNKGYSLTELGYYKEATEAYDQIIEQKPDYARVYAYKARTLRLLELYDEALIYYDKALELQPQYAGAWQGKGMTLFRMERYEEALVCYKKATDINPNDVWYWYNRADVLHALERFEDAIGMIETGLNIHATHPNSWAKLGQLYRQQNKFEEAVKAYERAIRIEPTYGWAHNGLGLTFMAMGHLEDAVQAFKRAVHFQPQTIWHWYNLTEVLVDMGQFEDAVEPARQAVQIDPKHVPSWAKLGQVMRYMGQYEEALEAYNRAVELDPTYAWAYNGRGLVFEHIGRYDDALENYRQAASLSPDTMTYLLNQIILLTQLRRYEEALKALDRAIEINPQHAQAWARRGQVLRRMQRLQESIVCYTKALELDQNYAWAWNGLGLCYAGLNNWPKAQDSYRRAVESDDRDVWFWHNYAEALIQTKALDTAEQALQSALELDPRHQPSLELAKRLERSRVESTDFSEVDDLTEVPSEQATDMVAGQDEPEPLTDVPFLDKQESPDIIETDLEYDDEDIE